MTIAIAAAGTHTSTGASYGTVATVASPGVYVIVIDINDDMHSGDELLVIIEARVADGGVYQPIEFRASTYDTEDYGAFMSQPVVAPYGWRCRLRQISATGRDYNYHVVQVA